MGPKSKRWLKFFSSILFSHIGFCLMVCGYIVGGAYLMRYVELPNEIERIQQSQILAHLVDDSRDTAVETLLERLNVIGTTSSNSNSSSEADRNTTVAYVQQQLDAYHKTMSYVRVTTQYYGLHAYKGSVQSEGVYAWSVPSSILFTATILSTVGYGHIFPVTEAGYIICMLYSVIAIPLMSMFLVNMSGLSIHAIRRGFHGGLCEMMHRRRAKSHVDMLRGRNSTTMNPNEAWTIEEDGQHVYAPPPYEDDRVVEYKPAYAYRPSMHRGEHQLLPASMGLGLFLLYFTLGICLWHTVTESTSDWSLLEAAYYSLITLMTIGFGDFVPGFTPRREGASERPDEALMIGCAVYVLIGSIVLTTAVGMGFEAMWHRRNKGGAGKRRNAITMGMGKVREQYVYDHGRLWEIEDPSPPRLH